MSSEIKLNFYDEVVVLNISNKDYKAFKAEIAKRYGIDPSDVNELIVYYFDTDKVKNFVKNEKDYITLCGNSKKFTVVVFLEIHEESRLFKEGPKSGPFNVNTGSGQSNVDKIRNEILEKELLLKKTIELEKLEMQKKKEETKKKIDEENKKKKLEELRAKKQMMELEEEERKKREKIELENEVTKLMN
jgi:hypothetical protein